MFSHDPLSPKIDCSFHPIHATWDFQSLFNYTNCRDLQTLRTSQKIWIPTPLRGQSKKKATMKKYPGEVQARVQEREYCTAYGIFFNRKEVNFGTNDLEACSVMVDLRGQGGLGDGIASNIRNTIGSALYQLRLIGHDQGLTWTRRLSSCRETLLMPRYPHPNISSLVGSCVRIRHSQLHPETRIQGFSAWM